MVEEILEGVLFAVEPGIRYVITEKRVIGGEVVRQNMEQMRAPLSVHLLRASTSTILRQAHIRF